MGACPFCKGDVDDDILTFGGRCPHCLIEIPGEEAPTDPGADARAAEEAAQAEAEAVKKSSAGRMFGALAVLALICLLVFVGTRSDDAPIVPIPTGSEAYKKVSGQFLSIDLDDDADMPPPPKEQTAPPKKPRAKPASKPRAPAGSHLPDTSKLTANDDAKLEGAVVRDDDGPVVADGAPPPAADPTSSGPTLGEVLPSPAPRRKSSLTDMKVGGGPVDRITGVELCGDDIREGAKKVMHSVGTQLTTCADRMVNKNPDFEAAVRVSIKVAKTGKVAAIDLRTDNSDPALVDCMEKVVSKTRFPRLCEAIDLSKTYKLGR
jgi:hypothetical protein